MVQRLWPKSDILPPNNPSEEADEINSHAIVVSTDLLIPLDQYSVWCVLLGCSASSITVVHKGLLSVTELSSLSKSQSDTFQDEIDSLMKMKTVTKGNCLQTLHPLPDKSGLLRVGGWLCNSQFVFPQRHPIILHGKHLLTKLIIRAEHLCLLHAGPTLVHSSLFTLQTDIGQLNLNSTSRMDHSWHCIRDSRNRLPILGSCP